MYLVKGKSVDEFSKGDWVVATNDSHSIRKGYEYQVAEEDEIKYVIKEGYYVRTILPIFKLRDL